MIIDLILDRKDGTPYEPKTFYNSCMDYGSIADEITRAMDAGTEENTKAALCAYIDEQEYNPETKNYIHSVKWLETVTEQQKKCGLTALIKRRRIEEDKNNVRCRIPRNHY